VLVITDDNPRSESPRAIRAAIMGGAMRVGGGARAEVHDEGDRRAAIALAVNRAGPGDAVLVLGKGHEQGQEAAGVITPFDDRVELRSALGGAA
jgi:UDP-N-acetylmuramoyl-L-alanyl-D-glutamate--2,6-diaminopimelate ligase